jgi:hypothetical protein
LQTTLTSMTLQNQISSASSLIGKSVQGNDVNNQQAAGTVTSISISQTPASQSATGVATTNVNLNLNTGDTMPLANVTSISQQATAAPSAQTAQAATVQAAAQGATNQSNSLVSNLLAPILGTNVN